jgi:hypothetical protein
MKPIYLMAGSHEILSFAGRSAAGPQHPPGLLGEGDPWHTPVSLSFEGILNNFIFHFPPFLYLKN